MRGGVDGDAADDGAEDVLVWRMCWGAVRRSRSRTTKSARKPGARRAFGGFAELGEGGGLGVGVDGFGDGEALLGVEGLGAGFVLAGDGGVEAAEGVDGFDGVVGAEGEGMWWSSMERQA